MANKKAKRYGLHYISNGRLTTTPYQGFTFTKYMASRNPLKENISFFKNHVLKAKVVILPVK